MHGKAADLFLPAAQPCDPGQVLVVGLVNNSTGRAAAVTGQQFRDLVGSAAGGRQVVLREETLSSCNVVELARLDALIVTGAEPGTTELHNEVFWPPLARLIDTVAAARTPCLFSCLAAHAAVLRLDGIRRVRLDRKSFGVFEQALTGRHPLLRDMPQRFLLPHSRWNRLPDAELRHAGYRLLSRSHDGSVDMFSRPGWPATLFLQSHPEYDEQTLHAQYRRDAKRFLEGRQTNRPLHPVAVMEAADDATPARWAGVASLLVSNWLACIAQGRRERGVVCPGGS